MTYYKYVSREGADVVDWGAITKSVSESLGQIAKDREAKREAIDEASRKTGETLANAPMGESKTINDFTIEYANNAEKYRLMQDRLLQSGQMSLKDYNIGRANLTSGTTELFNLAKEYNAVYADKMERMNKKSSSLAESWAMGNIEGYSNFSKSSAYIDPTNGKVAVGMKVKKTLPDGKEVFELSDNPNDLKSVNELRNIIDTKYDRFKVSQNLQPGVDELSETIKVLMKDGIKTRDDARQNPNYLNARNTFINSFIETNPDIPMSVLVDYLGVVPDEKGEATDVSFEFTYDPKEAATSNKFILMQPNENTGRYEAKLNNDQKEMARKALTTKFEAMVDREDTAMPIEKLTAGEKLDIKQAQRVGEAIGKTFYSNDTNDFEVAINLIKGQTGNPQNIVDYDFKNNPNTGEPELILTKLDKNGRRLQLPPIAKSENAKDYFTSVVTEFAPKGADIDEIVKVALASLPTDAVRSSTEFKYSIQDAPKPIDKFEEYIETKLPEISKTSSSQAKKDLELIFGNLGLDFEVDTARGVGANVTIKIKDGVEKRFDLDSDKDIKDIKAFLIKNYGFYKKIIEQSENIIDEELRGIDRTNPPQPQPGPGDAIIKQQ